MKNDGENGIMRNLITGTFTNILKYCTVLAVRVGFTDYTTQLVTLFYCQLYSSVLQSFLRVDSDPLMSCVGAVCCLAIHVTLLPH
jgi:hypothetical protein